MSSPVAGSGGFSESGTLQRIHRIFLGQKGPQDPGVLVRDRHGGPVVTPSFIERQDPGVPPFGFLL